MKVFLIIVGTGLALLIGGVWYIAETERQESHFETYQELRSSKLIAKGWVPDILPLSAYDIHEEHRVDEPRIHVWFRFLPGDITRIAEGCTRQSNKNEQSAVYTCKHGHGAVTVALSEDGRGDIANK